MKESITRDKTGKFIPLAKLKEIENDKTREIGRRFIMVLTLLCAMLYLVFRFI